MASSSGSAHIWAIQKEAVAGVLPTPFTPTTQRILEGGDIADNRSALVSSELTPDRQIKSSTLGAQKPEVSFGVEYSFDTFDLLLESVFQNTWQGAGLANGLLIDVAANTLTTDSGATWASLGFADGDVITVTGLTASAQDGSYLIASGAATAAITITDLAGGAVTNTVEADATLVVVGGRLGTVIDTSTNTLTVVATTRTITAGSAIWKSAGIDLRYNDLIYLKGFANAANNGYFKIESVTDTVLTLHEDSVLADETISAGDVEVANNTGILTVASEKQTFSILSGYEDVSLYRTSLGNQVGSASISFSTDSIVTGDFSIMGLEMSDYVSTNPASNVIASTTTPVFNSFRGFITFNDSAPACLLSLDISLDNNSEGLQCLFTKALDTIVSGKSNCTGSFVAYFTDEQLSNLYSAETPVNMFTVMEDADGNSMGIGIPVAQLQSDTNQINETTVEQSVDFQSLGTDPVFTNIYMIKSRAIPA